MKNGAGLRISACTSIKGGAEIRMRTEIIAHFSLIVMKKRLKVIFLLGLPGKVLFSEQSKGKHPLWIPPATSDPCGMVDTSTPQMMLNPICLAKFLLWVLLYCFVDFILKMIFCGCSASVLWLTSSRLQSHKPLK